MSTVVLKLFSLGHTFQPLKCPAIKASRDTTNRPLFPESTAPILLPCDGCARVRDPKTGMALPRSLIFSGLPVPDEERSTLTIHVGIGGLTNIDLIFTTSSFPSFITLTSSFHSSSLTRGCILGKRQQETSSLQSFLKLRTLGKKRGEIRRWLLDTSVLNLGMRMRNPTYTCDEVSLFICSLNISTDYSLPHLLSSNGFSFQSSQPSHSAGGHVAMEDIYKVICKAIEQQGDQDRTWRHPTCHFSPGRRGTIKAPREFSFYTYVFPYLPTGCCCPSV
ncbi:uncharacterized protein LOC117047952 [Lacerta agilis]|uniref:uncharacterized protein LOC117047952 n=1 Tax=Lacerta agilis TaxID=80427 RepID=UPI001419B44B|nr:uncharacterized protein LOC117047952 [Lacerta agilis]